MKICLLLCLFSLAISPAIAAAPKIKFCYEDAAVYPWITGDEKGLIFTELKQVEKRLKIKFEYIRLPWKRCLFEAQSGNIDGVLAASFNKERAIWGIYPMDSDGNLDREARFHTDSFHVYVRKDSAIQFKDGKFENLGNNQIGVQLGYSVGNDLKDAGYAIHSSFATPLDLLKELDYSALQVAVLQNYEAARTIEENPKFKKKIIRLEPPFKIADQFLLFTKVFYQKNEELSKSIWQAIPPARKSLEYKKLEQSMLSKR